MKITIVAAMEMELAAAAQQLKSADPGPQDLDIRFLYTGVGIMESTYAMAREFDRDRPDLAIQAGIGGSFSALYGPGSVLAVGEEIVGDVGVVESHGFQNIFDMGFADPHGHPYRSGVLVNHASDILAATELPVVRGLTVNEISTDPVKMSMLTRKYAPVVESMEGAPFHYVCLDMHIPFLQIRAISNFTGERDMSKWDFKGSIHNLNETLIRIVHIFAERPLPWN